jgi:hypothetical protein
MPTTFVAGYTAQQPIYYPREIIRHDRVNVVAIRKNNKKNIQQRRAGLG